MDSEKELQTAKEEMKIRGFSPKTIKSYSYHIRDFLEYCGCYNKERKREYILYLINRKLDSSTVRLASAAIDFHIINVKNDTSHKVPIPKRKKRLPNVITKEQIKAMIQATTNLKHRLIIELLYSSGVRLSELIHLKVEDIGQNNGTIRVRQGKGSKDRITIISKLLALRIMEFKHSGRVFEGRNGRYSPKSVQLVLEKAAGKAAIRQKVTPHMLRHSFATHLLEKGVDIRYIQDLLGHERLQTTQIYTHVANTKIKGIENPLDGI
ncbi:MAG: site-specific tyrosine recombinase/integron integrase [Candidatus Woesearchaeota archaeon]